MIITLPPATTPPVTCSSRCTNQGGPWAFGETITGPTRHAETFTVTIRTRRPETFELFADGWVSKNTWGLPGTQPAAIPVGYIRTPARRTFTIRAVPRGLTHCVSWELVQVRGPQDIPVITIRQDR